MIVMAWPVLLNKVMIIRPKLVSSITIVNMVPHFGVSIGRNMFIMQATVSRDSFDRD